ncbi:MAG: MOSC domain-containing protein [Chloroflexota bacterium]
MAGSVLAICVGAEAVLAKQPVKRARFVADLGLEGDRHARGGPRQVSILDGSVVSALAAEGIHAAPGELGENLLIEGTAVDALGVGARLRVGTALLEITEVRQPCKQVRALDPRALKALVGHAGRMARVLETGEAGPGDVAELVER